MKKVIVLMSTYNGEKYLITQIDSILNQKGVNVSLLVRDDGSSDSTCEILEKYKSNGKLKWYSGENLKPAKSFMNLIKNSEVADYYAFSDQDDYWLPNKLLNAVKRLEKFDNNIPSLYYSNTTLVDKNLQKMNVKKGKPYISLSFKQSIISSNATGCTMVFNKSLRDYLNKYSAKFQIMHDNWVHKVCTALNGNLYYDNVSNIYYRQHENNTIGVKTSILSRIKRHFISLTQKPCYRSRSIAALYNGYCDVLQEDNKNICLLIKNYKKGLNRFKLIFDRDFVTGNFRIDFLFRFAVLFGVF